MSRSESKPQFQCSSGGRLHAPLRLATIVTGYFSGGRLHASLRLATIVTGYFNSLHIQTLLRCADVSCIYNKRNQLFDTVNGRINNVLTHFIKQA
jgi:hypothetical protein